MAQAVPWNVRGIDPDVRDAALQAARRSGMTLGQWLNAVIGDTVGSLPDEAEADHADMEAASDPLDAVTRRIASLRGRSSSMAMAASGALTQGAGVDRVAKIIESAVETMDRNARDREAKTAAALEALTEMIESQRARILAAPEQSAKPVAEAPRVAAQPTMIYPRRRWTDQPSNEAIQAGNPVRQIIDRIESRLDTITEQSRTEQSRAPKVEASLRELDRRLQDIARKLDEPSKKEPVVPQSDENIRRIEGKLATILDTLNHQTLNTLRAAAARQVVAEPAPTPVTTSLAPPPLPAAHEPKPEPVQQTLPHAPVEKPRPVLAQRDMRSAIDDITLRQRQLDSDAETTPAVPQQPQIGELKLQLQRLSEKIGSASAAGFSSQIEKVRGEISSLSHAIEDLAPRHVVVSIEGAIRDLASRIEQTRDVGLRAQQLAPVEKLLVDLRIAVESLRESSAIEVLRGDLKILSERLAANAARGGNDREALQALQTQMAELRELITRAQEPVALEGLENRISNLTEKLERIADRPEDTHATAGLASAVADVRTTLQNALPTDLLARIEKRISHLGRIEEHLGEIAAHMQDVPGRADIDALHARMDRMHTTLLERPAVDTAISSQDVSTIQAMLLSLSDKIDTAQRNDDETALATVQTQIARIAERLDESGVSLGSNALDQSLKQLVSQLDTLRQSTIEAAESAARSAVRDSGGQSPGLDAIARDLAGLRQSQGEADHRTQLTLAAVNDALAEVVHRLGQLENDASQPKPSIAQDDTLYIPAKPTTVARTSEAPGRSAPAVNVTGADRAAPVDLPLEPGLGRPGAEKRPAKPDAEPAPNSKAAFIAAARRAAKTAEGQATSALQAPREAAGAAPAPAGSAKKTLTTHRKPIILGIAAVLVGLVALQAFNTLRGTAQPTPGASEPADSATAPETPKKQSQAATLSHDKTASAPLAQPSDPQRVGSIAAPASAPAVDAPQPLPLSLKQLAELAPLAASISSERLRNGISAGDSLALHEIGIRFMEGRGAPRDPVIGAKFLEASARLGLAPAQYRIGSLYREGRGVTVDKAKALEWFRIAANNGNARAMHNVGVLLAEGVSGAADYAAAAEWFNRASDLNVRDSQYNLAILYARGLGVTQDLSASYKWFTAAANQGDEDARKKRDDIAARMSPEQLAAAKATTAAWQALPLNPQANEVSDPAGGWDAPTKASEKEPEKVSDKRKAKSASL